MFIYNNLIFNCLRNYLLLFEKNTIFFMLKKYYF